MFCVYTSNGWAGEREGLVRKLYSQCVRAQTVSPICSQPRARHALAHLFLLARARQYNRWLLPRRMRAASCRTDWWEEG
jgi:hypothetical protein